MTQAINQKISGYITASLFFLYLLLFVSMALGLRAISSISIGLIFLLVITRRITERRSLITDNLFFLFVIGCATFYIVQLLGCINNLDDPMSQKHLRIKSALLFVPIAVGGSGILNTKTRYKLLSFFSIAILGACFYCLVSAFVRYFQTNDPLSFFYYELVNPLSLHAIHFSILVFIALVFLMESLRKKEFLIHKSFYYGSVIFLSAFLFLLSSRIVISFYIVYILLSAIMQIRKKLQITIIISILLASSYLVFISDNPVSQRYREIIHGDLSVVRKDRYTPGDYFSGLQFRLLYWRFIPEILSEQNRWVTGVSPGNSQSLLNRKYIEKNVYIGEWSRGDTGFLGYNSHNQLLESLLQSGIIGACIFLFLCFILIKMCWRQKNRILTTVTILLLVYSLIESLFETQYGILLFVFFPLFLYDERKQNFRSVNK